MNDSTNEPKSTIYQKETFLSTEGDAWFSRNRDYCESFSSVSPDLMMLEQVLIPFKDEIKRCLEVGCSNGKKIQSIAKFLDCNGEGIDPSAAAVNAGNEYFGQSGIEHIRLIVGSADKLPFEDGAFDLLYFGFCIYLVDRSQLFRLMSEADRVLRPGGFLAITDFDSKVPLKRPYHHREGVFTFKNNYAEAFTCLGHYTLMSKHSFSHQGSFFSKDPAERVAISILYKEPDPYISQ